MNLTPARLGALGPFKGVPASELTDLCQHVYGRRLVRGEVLFAEGEPAREAAIVLSGRLGVSIGGASGAVSVGDIWPGDLVGDAALLDRHGHRNATVTATMDTECAVFGPDLLELLPHNRGVVVLELHLLRHMAKRIRAANARIERGWMEQHEEPAESAAPRPGEKRVEKPAPAREARPPRPATAPTPTPPVTSSLRSALLRILGVS